VLHIFVAYMRAPSARPMPRPPRSPHRVEAQPWPDGTRHLPDQFRPAQHPVEQQLGFHTSHTILCRSAQPRPLPAPLHDEGVTDRGPGWWLGRLGEHGVPVRSRTPDIQHLCRTGSSRLPIGIGTARVLSPSRRCRLGAQDRTPPAPKPSAMPGIPVLLLVVPAISTGPVGAGEQEHEAPS